MVLSGLVQQSKELMEAREGTNGLYWQQLTLFWSFHPSNVSTKAGGCCVRIQIIKDFHSDTDKWAGYPHQSTTD